MSEPRTAWESITKALQEGGQLPSGPVSFVEPTFTVPDGGVTTAKIANGAVTAAKLDPSISFGGTIADVTGLQAALDAKASLSTATTTANGLISATDKTKLDGIQAGATNYVHPATHPATMITEDATHLFMTTTERTKLTGIAAGAEVNQNTFTTVAVSGQADVVADAKTDTLTLVGGTGITITTNAATDAVTITATGSAAPGLHATTHVTGGTDVIPNAVAGGNSGLMSGSDKNDVEVLKAKDQDFSRGHYQIPGEATVIYRVKRAVGVDHTVVEIAAPDNGNREATLTLMREVDPDSGGPEFLDLYNMGYADGKQYGIRIQKRGTGQFRDFLIEFSDGTTRTEVVRVNLDFVLFEKWLKLKGPEDNIIDFLNGTGTRVGYVGRIISDGLPRMVIHNQASGKSIELHDDGTLKYGGNTIDTTPSKGVIPYGTDLNTVTTPGTYVSGGTTNYTNAPPASWCVFEVLSEVTDDLGNVVQRATSVINGEMYFRVRDSGFVWNAWRTGVADGAVTTAKLADLAVTTVKIAALAVDTAKIASNAVTDVKFGNRTITDTVVADAVASTPTNLWSKLGYMIKAITGKANWYTAPVTTIEALSTGKLDSSTYTAADVLAKLITVDGPGSGLDSATVGGKTITTSAAAPTGGIDGDIWIQY